MLVFVAALAWRAAFLGRLAAGPLADHLQGDERIYWDWSSALLQSRFHATNPFFLGPLYPYLLAGLRILTGPGIGPVLMVQSVLGSAAAALLTDAARRLARPAIAVIVGLAFALYGMIVLFDALVLMESTLVCLEVVLLWLLVRTSAGERPTRAFLALGAVVGLCAECRATELLLIVPVAALALTPGRPTPGRVVRRLVPALGACALVVLPAAVWNQRAAHELIPFTYNFGYNLYVGNNPAANGEYVDITGGTAEPVVALGRADGGGATDGREYLQTEEGLALTPGGSSSLWARRAWAFARRRPLLVLALAGRKLLLAWNHDEVTQIESSSLYRQLAGPLGLPVLGTFGFLGLLGLAGLPWPRAPGADVRTLRLCVVLATAGMLPFFVTDRYRVHLVPGLALLAAATLERALAAWRAGDARRLRAFAVACAGAGAIVALPIRGDAARREQWTNLEDVGTRWAEHARTDRAIACYERALELERRLGYDRDPDPATARSRALLAYNYAVALHHEGRDPESLRWFESAVRDDPGEARYVRTLADAYRASGRAREADSTLSRLGGLVGGEA
ncbi:MAG TPA: tetratricopeptide repeat protein, partial [Candidatus Eisenbacteria bacterium]|nr:tetratricopeptide repeat protein [Candidatus Eisenbacteria bacterium]